ncbi:hypothetical protein Lal_00039574 [Lupinus albus]|nr:hypothetical protein Lal_00039574 [Lupinus albus]
MELGRLTLHEESDKRKKGLSLKESNPQVQEERDEDNSDSEIENETMAFLGKNPKDRFSCHECGKADHMKYQCPTYLKKVEGDKNKSREFKSKKAYIVWDVPEEDSITSTSEEEENSKLCLMAYILPLPMWTNKVR